MERFADLDKAAREGAINAVLAGLKDSPGPTAAQVQNATGGSEKGERPKTIAEANYGDSTPKSLSEIVGQFGKDLYTDIAKGTLSYVGKSDDPGPLVSALMAYDKAAQNGFKVPEEKSSSGAQPVSTGANGGDPLVLPGLGDTSETISYDPNGGTAQWRPLIKVALARTGQSEADAERTETQMDYESGGNPGASNGWDSNAAAGNPSKGLMQVIETTYQGVKGKWPQHFAGLPEDLLNPLTNIVAGIDACVNSWGSLAARWPTREGYADGGRFMATGVADRVAPSTFRIIGDNPSVDEYYLPDRNDPRTLALGAEWAERQGFQLVRMGQQSAPARELVGATAGAGSSRSLVVNNNGFDRREVAAGIDTAERRARFEQRRNWR